MQGSARPRDHLPVGAAVHPAVDRRGTPCRHAAGDRWFVDETDVKVAGRWVYLYRSIDQYGQVIDVLVSRRGTWRRLGTNLLASDRGVDTRRVPRHRAVRNNSVEADHGRLKAWLRPMRGLKQLRSTRVMCIGHPSCRTPSGPLRTRHGYRPTASTHSALQRTWPAPSD